jgi:hypothetical protein
LRDTGKARENGNDDTFAPQRKELPRLGLEPSAGLPEGVENTAVADGEGGGRTEYGTKSTGSTGRAGLPDDPELQAVVAAWPRLAEPIRAGILAMVRASASTL